MAYIWRHTPLDTMDEDEDEEEQVSHTLRSAWRCFYSLNHWFTSPEDSICHNIHPCQAFIVVRRGI